ncbi:DUF4007 family protein [Thiohalocapsa marina]|uniref:DUF4007 family protein n=2 Tax=Thiohalocapsa marina TaxID=424902 RepID=A0A5M8FI90_9GAMM|nr:DUF4007 family protein [Thiohalocapsa marina]
MRLARDKATFGRHETFPLRYGWLPKGYESLKQDPQLLSDAERAMITLGVGRNMVNAIHYWLQVAGVIDFSDGPARPTRLGQAMLGTQGDPYLEDDATLWILHWLIASNAEHATGFFWFFNHFAMPRFRDADALSGLTEFVGQALKAGRSQSTLKSDISTLLRMYAAVEGRTDEHLDSPLAQLGLVEPDADGGYRSVRSSRPFLPPFALHFALSQRFRADPTQPALPVRVLLYGGDGWAAPGAVFRLSEEGLMGTLERVIEHYPHSYELRDTAGVHQIYRRTEVSDPLDVLRAYYQRK